MTDHAGSLVTSSRPPGRLQKRPDDRTWNAGVAVRTADGSRRTADAGDEQCLRCGCSSPSCTVVLCAADVRRSWWLRRRPGCVARSPRRRTCVRPPVLRRPPRPGPSRPGPGRSDGVTGVPPSATGRRTRPASEFVSRRSTPPSADCAACCRPFRPTRSSPRSRYCAWPSATSHSSTTCSNSASSLS